MKKLILISLSLFIPLIAGASFDKNLYYGLQSDSQVKELQEFLTDQGVYSGPITGNFLSLTLKAVKSFQQREALPQTGYFGPLSRTKSNDLLSAAIESSNQGAITETGTTPPTPIPPATTNDVVSSLQLQIALLVQQITLLQSQATTLQQTQQQVQQQTQVIQQQQQTIQQIQQNTQQIVQNTTPLSSPVIPKVKGCMDSAAINYNSSAEESNGSCQYAVLKYEIKETSNFVTQSNVYKEEIKKKIVLTAVNDDFNINEYVFNMPSHNSDWLFAHPQISPYYWGRSITNDNKYADGTFNTYSCDENNPQKSLFCSPEYIYCSDLRLTNNSFFPFIIKSGTSLTIDAGSYIDEQIQDLSWEIIYLKATGVRTGKVITLP